MSFICYTFHSYHALDTPDNVLTHSVDQYKNEKVYTIGTEKHRSIIFNTSGWGDIKLYRTLFKSNTPDVSALQGYQQFLDTSGRDMKRTSLINLL